MATETVHFTFAPKTEIKKVETVQLEFRGMYCLPHGACRIRVLNGCALVTSKKDHILKAGDELVLFRQPHAVIVSALAQQRLRFEVHKL